MCYHLDYSLVTSAVCGLVSAVLLLVLFAVSRLCRCLAALLLPSLCTARGRIAALLVITGILVGGPVRNVYLNAHEMSRSMACSAEQAYNQSMTLLEPFDYMMTQLDVTVQRLQDAAYDVSVGLEPLDRGLSRTESDLQKGRIQIEGTEDVSDAIVSCLWWCNACYHSLP